MHYWLIPVWTAYDFGLIATPTIVGTTRVSANEQNITYTVPAAINARYEWTFPEDCKVVKNDNSNSITLNWSASSGCINVTQIDGSNDCKKQFKTLFVTVK
jgi:hypothetical protein